MALLPFEPGVHQRLGGPPCTYVGHPLSEHIARLRPNPSEAARREASPPVLLILPGSRPNEIARLSALFGAVAARAVSEYGPLEIVLPTVASRLAQVQAAIADWRIKPRVVVDAEEKYAAFRIARAALAASGTVTLELALAGVPTVAAYRLAMIEGEIARWIIRVPSFVLANLVLGENVVPELLQYRCTKPLLTSALIPLLTDTPQRRRQVEAFARLDSIMDIAKARPSQRAADVVLQACGR
jgi:lipid-A-disaccharide synthase